MTRRGALSFPPQCYPPFPMPQVPAPQVSSKGQRPLVVCLVLAALLHLPVTPLASWFRLASLLVRREDPPPQPETRPETTLPIELVEPPAEASPGANAVALPSPPATDSPPEKKPAQQPLRHEKTPQENTARSSHPTGKAHASARLQEAHASQPSDGPSQGPQALAMDGSSEKTIGHPEATLTLWLDPWRQHPARAELEALFQCNPLWKPFLAVGLSPLQDLDGVMVSTAQPLEPRASTFLVSYRVEDSAVDQAMDELLSRSGAQGARLAPDVRRLRLWGRPVLAFRHPEHMLLLTPTEGWQELHDLPDPIELPAARGRALAVELEHPAPELATAGLHVPDRLQKLRLDVSLLADGSGEVFLQAESPNDSMATEDAAAVSSTLQGLVSDLSQAASLAGALSGVELHARTLADSLALTAQGRELSGSFSISTPQTQGVLKLLSRFICGGSSKH